MNNASMDHRLGKAFGLTTRQLETVMADALTPTAMRQGVWSEVYLQRACHKVLVLSEGIIKRGETSNINGGGVRTINPNGHVGYSSTARIGMRNLRKAAGNAREILNDGRSINPVAVRDPLPGEAHDLYHGTLKSATLSKRCAMLREAEAIAFSVDSRIRKVSVSLSVSEETIAITNTNGLLAVDDVPMLHLSVECLAVDGNRRESGSAGGGGRIDFEVFASQGRVVEIARNAAELAIRLLKAEEAPSGVMPIVLGNGWTGILTHEAVGHGLEGDFNRKLTSAYSGRLGQLVASPLVTIIDDGTLQGRRGSLNFDGEGTPTRQNVLIRDGVLECYMQDQLNARMMGMQATGNGRRESYAYKPMPRMTTTGIAAGHSKPAEIIKSVKYGLYAPSFSSGQVDITSGNFVFVASEAWVIRDGELTNYVKGATIAGNGPEAMTRVMAVGDDLAYDPGIGTCGKGQSVPVGVFSPTVLIEGLTVGGKEQQS